MKKFAKTFVVRHLLALTAALAPALLPYASHAQGGSGAATAAEPHKYELGGISVSGARYLDPNTLIGLTGLRVGDPINVPGEEKIGRAHV